MDRVGLKKLAGDKRFIPGIYNYCDRWCERCPQTERCLNFSPSEEQFPDPESRDIRNEAFWRKLSGILTETCELLKEAGKKWGVDLETLDLETDTESMRVKEEAVENHVVSRAAKACGNRVEDWFKKAEVCPFETLAAVGQEMDLDEAFEVIRWYQFFIAAKVMRAIRGKMEEEDQERGDAWASDSEGSAKIALIAMDRSISAWAVILHHNRSAAENILEMISFLDRLRQALDKTFPESRSFKRPGFDEIDLNE